jgi:hypothetical protein
MIEQVPTFRRLSGLLHLIQEHPQASDLDRQHVFAVCELLGRSKGDARERFDLAAATLEAVKSYRRLEGLRSTPAPTVARRCGNCGRELQASSRERFCSKACGFSSRVRETLRAAGVERA